MFVRDSIPRRDVGEGRLRIAIVGSGAVGKATGTGFESLGHDVGFHDKDPEKLTRLAAEEHRVQPALETAAEDAEVIFACVPAPARRSSLNLDAVLEVSEALARCVRSSSGTVVASS